MNDFRASVSIYVVSVKSFTERHAHINALARENKFEVEFVFEHDPGSLNEDGFFRVSDRLNSFSQSNVLKHFEAQRKFLASGGDYALVLEDDVVFLNNRFSETVAKLLESAQALVPGWLIFLGGADDTPPMTEAGQPYWSVIPKALSTAEAYIVDRVGCERRLAWCTNNELDRQADHQLKLVDNLVGNKQFWIARALVTQGSITGKFQTTLDNSRAKHGSVYLGARYLLRRFYKNVLISLWRQLKATFKS